MSRRRVVVTGMGLISPIGNDVRRAWHNACEGVSGIGLIDTFDVAGFSSQIAGLIKNFDANAYVDAKAIRKMDPFMHYGIAATKQAIEDSGLIINEKNANRIGIAMGAGIGGIDTIEKNHDSYLERGARRISPFFVPSSIINMISGHISIEFGITGPNLALATACATSTHSIGVSARLIAAELDEENIARRVIEEKILTQAIDMAEAQIEQGEHSENVQRYSLVLASSDWHPGVIGIVASRLVERFGRPTILIAIDGDKGKGSGRSPKPFHLYEGLKACGDLLVGYGGHRPAAGLSIRAESIPVFADQFEAVARQRLTSDDLVPVVEYDTELDVGGVGPEVLAELRRLEPYGQGNPEPVFRASQAEVVSCRIVGDQSQGKAGHLKLVLRSPDGGSAVDAIGFGMGDRDITARQRVDVLYTPGINVWNGNASLQLRLRDIKGY